MLHQLTVGGVFFGGNETPRFHLCLVSKAPKWSTSMTQVCLHNQHFYYLFFLRCSRVCVQVADLAYTVCVGSNASLLQHAALTAAFRVSCYYSLA